MEIRSRHWLLALGTATLAHAALVSAIHLKSRTLPPEPPIVINLGELGAAEGATGGDPGSGTPAAPLVRTLAAADTLTPIRASDPLETLKTQEIEPPPPVTRPRARPEPPKAKPKTKAIARPAQSDTKPQAMPPRTAAATDRRTGSGRGAGAGQGTSVGKTAGTGTGAAGKGRGKSGSGAGKGAGAGLGGKGLANYQGRLAAWLNRHKRYPDRARRLRQEGTVRVSFTIDRNGRLLSHRIVGGSGHPLLDQEVQAMLKRATPMPPFPPGMNQSQLSITVPISFNLH